jgi:hypothetical protein
VKIKAGRMTNEVRQPEGLYRTIKKLVVLPAAASRFAIHNSEDTASSRQAATPLQAKRVPQDRAGVLSSRTVLWTLTSFELEDCARTRESPEEQ